MSQPSTKMLNKFLNALAHKTELVLDPTFLQAWADPVVRSLLWWKYHLGYTGFSPILIAGITGRRDLKTILGELEKTPRVLPPIYCSNTFLPITRPYNLTFFPIKSEKNTQRVAYFLDPIWHEQEVNRSPSEQLVQAKRLLCELDMSAYSETDLRTYRHVRYREFPRGTRELVRAGAGEVSLSNWNSIKDVYNETPSV